MLVHVDTRKYAVKPNKGDIAGIKSRFTKTTSIKDLTAEQIAKALTVGQTVQPGVCPFSENSRRANKRGTVKEDFSRQTVFMNDIDNKNNNAPKETPAHVAEVLARHRLKPSFMYDTFNSTAENERFRYALVCDEEITDKAERDSIQEAIIYMFAAQADPDCTNADRIFFGTDKGLLDEYTDFEAVCSKADLLAITEIYRKPGETAQQTEKSKWTKFGKTIPVGERHGTLVSFANTVLKKYGVTEQAYKAYMERVAQCEEPKPDDEIQKIWRDACKYYESNIATQPDYLQHAEYVAQDFVKSLEPHDYTDVGQANVYVGQYGGIVRYSTATSWLVYNGMKWEENDLKAQGLAQELTERQLAEARRRLKAAQVKEAKATENGNEEKQDEANKEIKYAKQYREYVLDRRATSRISATLTEAKPAVQIDVMQLDADPYLLNTPAGTVDLKTGKMHPHNALDYCTKMTAVAPSMENMQMWLDFLDRLTCGDRDLQRYLQKSSGMEVVGKVFMENLQIAVGNGGNGKSSYYNAKFLVLGDYAGTLSAETLTVNCRKNKSPEYAELRGKRLVIAAELEEGMRLDTAIVKKLCSVDPIKAEKKFKAPFDFIPSHTTVLYTNHLPKVGTTDSGTWDRLFVVPFNANFRGMKGEIKNYADHLFRHCGGAILTWIIEGAKMFIAAEHKLEMPECVKAAIDEYHNDNDWLNAFTESCCDVSPDYIERAGDLFDAYRAYCGNVHEWARSATDFKAALIARGYSWKKTKTGAMYSGLRLKPEFAPITPL